MGVIKKIKCRSCKADWHCRTGCGMMHANLADAAALYPTETAKEICDSVTDEYPVFDFAYKLAHCTYCRDIIAVPVLMLGIPEEETKEYIGECEQCRKQVELIHDLSHTSCPVCEKNTLQEEEVGLWD